MRTFLMTLPMLFGAMLAGTLTMNPSARAQTAMPANLIISTGSVYDFGPVHVNQYSSVIFTMANVGNLPATNLLFLPLPLPFAFTENACGPMLAAGASCTFTVRFGSKKIGKYSTTIGLYYLDGAVFDFGRQAATIALSGTVIR